MLNDTITAITTAMGAASVGIVRISGPQAREIADKIFVSKKGIKLAEKATYTITYGKIKGKQGETVDEALALLMLGPQSFTGEDVVELQCHGGMIIMRHVLELVLNAGARLAEPGEFSKRAFLNGRLDLAQAEAIMDMINAKTEKAALVAVDNLQGNLSLKIKTLRDQLLEMIAYLEADIDFPEEDFPRLSSRELQEKIQSVKDQVEKIIFSFRSGRILREGLKTAIIGKPNVGKSSLLNAILREKRAIVTEIPGTTRDVIEEYYNLAGVPLILMDTAGIRETQDIVERIGVEKSRQAMKEADLILYVLDVTEEVSQEEISFIKELSTEKSLILLNKIDLEQHLLTKEKLYQLLPGYNFTFISAKAEVGLEDLEKAIEQLFFQAEGLGQDSHLLTNVRHKQALDKGRDFLASAIHSVGQGLPSDFISIDLQNSWEAMGEITGDTLGEDLIDQIFSQFCLGK